MTAKEYLSQYIQAEQHINAQLDEIARLRSMAERVTTTLGGDSVISSPGDGVARIIDRIVDMEREVDAEIDGLQAVKKRVTAAIRSVEDARLREVLNRRYICGQKLAEAAVCMGYSYDWTRELHGMALRKVKVPTQTHIYM